MQSTAKPKIFSELQLVHVRIASRSVDVIHVGLCFFSYLEAAKHQCQGLTEAVDPGEAME